jgi:hypothetical protein
LAGGVDSDESAADVLDGADGITAVIDRNMTLIRRLP